MLSTQEQQSLRIQPIFWSKVNEVRQGKGLFVCSWYLLVFFG